MKLPVNTLILIAVFLTTLLVFHWLERLRPINPALRTGPKRGGYLSDLFAQFVDGPALSSVMKIVAASIVMNVPALANHMTGWPWAAQFAAFFLFNDFGRYWLHRWHHEIGWMWRIHRVHHSPVEMDALSASRVHVFEGIIKYGLLVLPFRVLGIDPTVILVYSILDIIKAFWHHANLKTEIGKLNYVLNSAELHWWHHAMEGPGQHSNYGSVLSIWDRLFGTFYFPRGQWPERIGVEGCERFPRHYPVQFVSVFLSDEEARRRYGARAADAAQAKREDHTAAPDAATAEAALGAAHSRPA